MQINFQVEIFNSNKFKKNKQIKKIKNKKIKILS